MIEEKLSPEKTISLFKSVKQLEFIQD